MVSVGINYGGPSSPQNESVSQRLTDRTGIDLAEDLQELKRKRNAVILAHNYQVPELQDVADFVGDSLGLSYQAAKTDADVILFCGVHFMAETAKIINPTKRVILPDLEAGCSLSESCPPEKLAEVLKRHGDKNYYVIAYINWRAGLKAQSEIIIVTEAGMLHRLKKEIPDKTFIPEPTDNCFCGECRFMKMNTLEKAYGALLNMEPEITLPESIRQRAELPILRMLELSR